MHSDNRRVDHVNRCVMRCGQRAHDFGSRHQLAATGRDWLYLPETLYAFMLIMAISAGAGGVRARSSGC